MDDLTRRIHQQNALNYQRTQKQKKEASPPPLLRIGEYHPETGRYKVLFPDGGQVIGGVKLFNSSVPTGTPVRSTRAYGAQSIGLDYKNYQPILIQEEEFITSTPETQELPPPTTTCITMAGISLDENGFADEIIEYSGNFITSGGTLEDVLVDKKLETFALSYDSGAYIKLGFSKPVINNSGNNIALFDLGFPDIFKITINNVSLFYEAIETGYFTDNPVYSINFVLINLSDFGLSSGDSINEIIIGLDTIHPDYGTPPSLALVAALCPL